jgi:hypothetical protein
MAAKKKKRKKGQLRVAEKKLASQITKHVE